MAEWLGTGLQNQLQRFESARNLRRRKAPARDASWGFLLDNAELAREWMSKKTKGLRQQRTGAFLLTLGDNAVRLSAAKAIRLNPKHNLIEKKTPGACIRGFLHDLGHRLQQIIRRHPFAFATRNDTSY